MAKTQQADDEIHENQLLNFLIKSVDEEVAFTLAENVEIDAEDIYEVPSVYAPTRTSVSTLCERNKIYPTKLGSLPSPHQVRS